MNNYCIIAFDLFNAKRKSRIEYLDLIEKVRKEFLDERKFVLFGAFFGGAVAVRYANLKGQYIKGIIIAGTPFYSKFILYILSLVLNFIKVFNPILSKVIETLLSFNEDNLKKISKPTLLLYSKNNNAATAKMGKKIHKIIQSSTLYVFDDRTHGWLLHRIDDSGVLKEINLFMKSLYS